MLSLQVATLSVPQLVRAVAAPQNLSTFHIELFPKKFNSDSLGFEFSVRIQNLEMFRSRHLEVYRAKISQMEESLSTEQLDFSI